MRDFKILINTNEYFFQKFQGKISVGYREVKSIYYCQKNFGDIYSISNREWTYRIRWKSNWPLKENKILN